MNVGHIYGYRDPRGAWQYVGQSCDLDKRHRAHLKGNSFFERMLDLFAGGPDAFEGPVPLETIFAASENELTKKLRSRETLWMFLYETYRPLFKRGLNLCLPGPTDYLDLARRGAEATNAKRTPQEKREYAQRMNLVVHAEKDPDGKSAHTRRIGLAVHAEKDPDGKSIHARRMNLALHAEKDADGKSVHARRVNLAIHAEKDADRKSVIARRAAHFKYHVYCCVIFPGCSLCCQDFPGGFSRGG